MTTLRVLFVEDEESDMALEIADLRKGGFDVVSHRVDTEADMRAALKDLSRWDLVISDHHMPHFSSLGAIAVRNDLAPDLPLILVSGTIGEELAVRVMQEGAGDYLSKDNLRRLVPAVIRELREAAERRARRTAEEQARQLQKMELVGQLAGGVAHDFNNLLTVIVGYSDILLMQIPKGAAHHEELAEIRKAGERAAGLTRQLLAFSRKQILQPAVLDLNALLAETHRMIQRLIGAGIEMTIVPTPDLWHVRADPGQITQVIMNLCVNARDAMSDGGRLTICSGNVTLAAGGTVDALAAGDYVTLSVSDTGCGMGPEVLAHLFEPFFTTKAVGKGTGLGLATVHGIVRQSGGEIAVTSAVGAGSTFTVRLPRVDAPLTGIRAPATGVRFAGNETVLVVDDAEPIRRIACQLLRSHGYRALEAAEGLEALRVCEQQGVDLVLTDMVMPLMGGRELAELLARVHPRIPVVFMSGYSDLPELPGGSVLDKPFTPEGLLDQVRKALDAVSSGPGAPPSA